MLTDTDIEKAKHKVKKEGSNFEHNDCIRMAYEWLDAQKKTKGTTRTSHPLKHIIEKWAGRYVSMSDVEAAALLHPDIIGKYPLFNISAKLTEPNARRLVGIQEAFSQNQHEKMDRNVYKFHEL